MVSKLVLAAAAGAAVVDAAQLVASQKHGCGKMVKKHLAKNPGAGLGEIIPFQQSFKDGFLMVDCIKDSLLEFGDKFGDGKFSYNIGETANISIVHYADVVMKEDAEPMTHEVCFGFCRSLEEMNFFGITNGHDCYCSPYYKQVAGDSSSCDVVCDGNPTMMCGGKTKSSVFSMHACNDAQQNRADASAAALEMQSALSEQAGNISETSTAMQTGAASLQEIFGKVGDSAATDLAQAAKVFAGKLQHAGEDGATLAQSITDVDTKAAGIAVASAGIEKAIEGVLEVTAKAEASARALAKLEEQAIAPESETNASALYYPAMYFVDKEFVDMPSTCGGNLVGEPAVGDYEGCAEACEKTAGKCVGFSYLATPDIGLCFMFSTIETATYYTGCGNSMFLQTKVTQGIEAKCAVKMSEFVGVTLKPDPSGKCKLCLKKATKADRCF